MRQSTYLGVGNASLHQLIEGRLFEAAPAQLGLQGLHQHVKLEGQGDGMPLAFCSPPAHVDRLDTELGVMKISR